MKIKLLGVKDLGFFKKPRVNIIGQCLLIITTLIFLLTTGVNALTLDGRCEEANFIINESDIIVVAEIVAERYDNNAYTYSEIVVERYIKGSGPTNLVIKSMGGIADNGERLAVEPIPQKGEKGYLFLSRSKTDDGTYQRVCSECVINNKSSGWGKFEKALQQINNNTSVIND
jgi:hypothetical protein